LGPPSLRGHPPWGNCPLECFPFVWASDIVPSPLGHHGRACGAFLRSSRSLRCCRLLLHTQSAARHRPWLCPPVATGSTGSAVKVIASGCLSFLSIGLLQSQQIGLGCAINRSLRRLYSGSLVRLMRCLIVHQLSCFVVQLRLMCFECRYALPA